MQKRENLKYVISLPNYKNLKIKITNKTYYNYARIFKCNSKNLLANDFCGYYFNGIFPNEIDAKV